MNKFELALTRCDKCGAEAKYDVLIGEVDLRFCAHHYDESKDKLEAAGAAVVKLGELEDTNV